ncbi:MAG: hypothetical protein HRK26_02235 [Rickettsiaceae bacterium H1]|nr:hypothetical protein [Rickettsiaceae bacterium H1]
MYFSSANVAQAANKDYHRVEVESGGDKFGNSQIKQIKVITDEFLEQARIEQNSVVGYANVKKYFFDKINVLLGSPGLSLDLKYDVFPKNIVAAVEDFFSKVNLLSTTPESQSLKISVIKSAEHLSYIFSNIAYKLEVLRLEADEMIEKSCQSINENLQKLYDANVTLVRPDLNEKMKPHFVTNRMQALHDLSEHIDVSMNVDQEGRVEIYTEDGKKIFGDRITKFEHKSFSNVDLVISQQRFNGLFLQSGSLKIEINPERLSNGKIKGLVELRDKDIPDIISLIDQLAHKIEVGVNRVYSIGNPFPGHKKLISGSNIKDVGFTGKVKFVLLNENGQFISDEDDYVIRPLTVDLTGKTLEEVAKEISDHYFIRNNRVKIANYIDDVRVIPNANLGKNFSFDLEFNGAENGSNINLHQVSVLYGTELKKTLFSKDLDRNIKVNNYETVTMPINLDLANLPSAAKEFIVRVKMSIGCSYIEIDYVINPMKLQKYYSAYKVKGDESEIIMPQAKRYISSEFNKGMFSVEANDNFRFGIEDLDSKSKYGNFFHVLGWNNFFIEGNEAAGSALNFSVEKKIKEQSALLNTNYLIYNKHNLPHTGIADNKLLKEIFALKEKSINENSTFYKFATEIIEKVALQARETEIFSDFAISVKEALDDERHSISGVNVDEEIAKSMLLQNIHEASTKVIKIVDEMFSGLLSTI